MRRTEGEHVYGPYPHHRRWKVVTTYVADGGDRRRRSRSFETEAEGHEYVAEYRRQAQGRTVSAAVLAYLEARQQPGPGVKALRASSSATLGYRLRAIFQLDAKDRSGKTIPHGRDGGLLKALTPARAAALYKARVAIAAVDTHQAELAAAQAMLTWCMGAGWLVTKVNPFADVAPIGEKNAGKPQLRIDEMRKLLELVLPAAAAMDRGAIATAMVALFGLRASEASDRVVRDVDDDGRRLVIDRGKTAAAERALEVPPELQAPLLELARDRPSGAQLLAGGRAARGARGGKLDRGWVYRQVKLWCDRAGVPVISPHGLRGTIATAAAETGAPWRAYGPALGHTTPAITTTHYEAAGARQRGSQRAGLRVLRGGAA